MRRAIVLMSLIFFLVQCDVPFGTRDAEKPENTKSSSTWIRPTKPETVLLNLVFSIQEEDKNNYIRSIADSSYKREFKFLPEPSLQQQTVFKNWNLESEKKYVESFFRATFQDSLKFSSDIVQLTGDTAVIVTIYELEINHALMDLPKHFSGRVEMRFAKDINQNWAIYYWKDDRLPEQADEFKTWSFLKQYFSN